ncbi:MAG: hypothetical protein K0S44_2637 [Bacteroidetes bacterium]|jgi:hypothetical protein|nr:hypothetical protein [Bacteroidota bacterium]
MKKVLIFTLFFQGLFLNAQVAGYMGKRMTIGYSNYFSPSFYGRSANSTVRSLGMNTVNCFNVEYTIGKRTNFCVGGQFGKTGFVKEGGFNYKYYDSTYSDPVQTDVTLHYLPKNGLPMQMRSLNFSVGFKFFRSGYIAPVGAYTKVELLLFMNRVTYDPLAFYANTARYEEERIKTRIGTGTYNFKSLAIAATFGRQRILFDRLVLDAGIRLAVSPNMVLNFISTEVFGDGYNSTMEEQIRLNSNTRLFTAQLFNFHLGIGFLAF